MVKIVFSIPTWLLVSLLTNHPSFYGAEQSTRKDENRKKIEEFAQVSLVLECDTDTARLYGKIKSQLKIKGSPIPENDIWIAALAEQHQLTLVTRDKHFNSIEFISTATW